jgi:hypothetical protein
VYLSRFIFLAVKNAKNIKAIVEDSRNGLELSTVALQDCRQTKITWELLVYATTWG